MCNKKGSILMITLWILAILVIFAIGLGHRASINLRLARYQRDRLKATYLAKAGINKAMSISEEDAVDPENKNYDTIEACGVNLKGKEPKDIFSQQWNNESDGFKIGRYTSSEDFIYGLRDEESRININGISNIDNKLLLIELFRLKNIDNPKGMADTIINWIDEDKEEETIFKNQRLLKPEEVSVILEYFYKQNGKEKKESQDRAREVYNEVKELITVYGISKVNINTASSDILKVLARTIAKTNSKNETAADNLIPKIIAFRSDNPFKNQEAINTTELGEAEEKEIFDLMKTYLVPKSECFRIEVSGDVGNTIKNITTIYDRTNKKILYWHEN